jgi:hypothetical protein
MNCALIDDDDADDNDDVVGVGCAVDADGIMSAGMHEKREGRRREGQKRGTTRRCGLVDDGSRRGKRRRTGQ